MNFPTNEQLYDMLQQTNVALSEVTDELVGIKSELRVTQTIIRDYNGLRERVEEVAALRGHVSWDKVLTGLSIIVAIVAITWK